MSYTTEHFIRKFESIPDSSWCTGQYHKKLPEGEQCCALGHCHVRFQQGRGSLATPESIALETLFVEMVGMGVSQVNDYKSGQFQQATPKARVLAALQWIKEKAA